MGEPHDTDAPVKAKAVLVDADSFSVLWASDAVTDAGGGAGLTLEQAIPMAEALGLSDALRAVADTGAPVHLSTNLVTTGRGAVAYAVSAFRLPDGNLLVLSEHAWHVGQAAKKPAGGTKRPRRTR